MNYSIIRFIIGWVIKIEGLFMLMPALVSLYYKEYENFIVFMACAAVFTLLGLFMSGKKPKNTQFYAREGYVAVTLSWIVLSLIGCIPFVVTGEIPDGIDAIFETVSGFTTTGATILTDVESMSYGILFWRNFSNWIGGMGILVFLLIVLPVVGGQSIHLIKAESTGASVGKLVPRTKSTAFYLYSIYILMSAVLFVVLLFLGMKPFEAICAVFGTAGTGGLGVKADSMAGYSSEIQAAIAIAMLLFGVFFSLYFLIIVRRFRDALSMEEVKWYFIIFTVAVVAVACNLFGYYDGNIGESFKQSFFQVSSIMTSTGFATTDFDLWPNFSKSVLIVLMFVGACAGSTAGGIKVSRFLIWFKAVIKEIGMLCHPRSVKILKMDGKKIDHDTIRSVNVYLFLYIIIFVISYLIMILDNLSMEEAFSAVATALNNIGPAVGKLGPSGSFADLSPLSKIVLVVDMLIGRLEVYPVVVFLMPTTWRKQ